MKNKKIIILIFAVACLASCKRIDAGYEGILVKQYGTSRGVQGVSLVTGRVWYNPFTEDVIQYPIFMQTADYEAFSTNAKDGSIFNIDPMINYSVIAGKSPEIFVKYRKNIKELEKTILLTFTKDVFKNVFNKYSTDDILSKRSEFDNEVTRILTDELKREGIYISQLTFGMRYPESINAAIDAKNKATQQAQQKENELRVARANAEIMIVNATAEKQANELRNQSLTSLVIQQQFIEKWDGTAPLYGNVPPIFKTAQ